MKLQELEPGTYVIAVSGGVDSMVLLDILRKQPGIRLVVAHFDHGIRPDSGQDLALVERAAQQHGLAFVRGQGSLGPNASEDKARRARYAFLQKIQKEQGARAIITAHHQDDVLETAILNMLRGTGRKGLTSLASRRDVVRPLLYCSKAEIHAYAAEHHIVWREDSTNADERYLRNYIRRVMLPRLSLPQRQELLDHIAAARRINQHIDSAIAANGQLQSTALDRAWFVRLPYAVSCEVIAAWLRMHGVSDFDRPRIERLVTFLKTKQPGKIVDVNVTWIIKIGKKQAELCPRNNENTYRSA